VSILSLLILVALPLACGFAEEAASPKAGPVDYNRQIRHILADKCLACHGFDAAERKGELRLDVRDSALGKAESGKTAIVPGKPDQSELIARINSTSDDERMPPPETQKKLTDAEKALLKQWIAEGAKYQTHWAFTAPKKPALPAVKDKSWTRGEIDLFIAAKLDTSGLKPSREAEKTTLIRRVTLDLTGLPPTPAEVDAFFSDKSADAYERLVDRLLASPFHGERMAVDWLDASRFADTHGYHIDSGRDMTRWREYVIESFNRGLSWDQFTIEQLAGDLLPDTADPEDNLRRKIASGFNRNNMINFEGGAIPQEYLNAYIVDRVNTTGTVFLGLTVGCTQCHDHKFDPLTQKDFYSLYAFFNTLPENGLDGSKGNAAPLMKAPRPGQDQSLAAIGSSIADLEKRLASPLPEVDAAQLKWEVSALEEAKKAWQFGEVNEVTSKGGATLKKLPDGSYLAEGKNPDKETYEVRLLVRPELKQITALRLEALPDDSLPMKSAGRSANGNIVMTGIKIAVRTDAKGEGEWLDLPIKAAEADFSQKEYQIGGVLDTDPANGWGIYPEVGKAHQAMFTLTEPLALGSPREIKVTLEFQSQFSQHQIGRFRLAVSSTAKPQLADVLPAEVATALPVAADKRSDSQAAAVKKHYREKVSPEFARLNEQMAKLKKEREDLEKNVHTVMVMQDMPKPRETFVLVRGAYDKPGEKVTPNVPTFLPPLPEGATHNRLALAKWLIDPQHPLMSRVTVNRYWQMFFGTGLVKTSEDFGTQGELPTHPQLLDWLATEFNVGCTSGSEVHAESGRQAENAHPKSQDPSRVHFAGAHAPYKTAWDVKCLIRRIVTSSTYRQSSVITPDLKAKDPENRLLARGPRHRLQAEFIRDEALFLGGLLNRKIGGNSVSPYQPAGIWEELASRSDGKNWTAQEYSQSHGEDLYRRTMYTFWKRTAPPPSLMTFDAPDRETCTVRRARTNTPLQALVLMNDPTYVEASRKFAERIMKDGGGSTDERLKFAFRSTLSRAPSAAELVVLRNIYDKQLTRFKASPDAAHKLLAVGELARDESLDAAELAAWSIVASALMNLDETLTKG
ncbi:MAG: PSD1 and planctomycete cytochrome C domain-containing protein, partial [Planctomycetales bacterium]|nr:PSD1 and planctomycete cytochrome C domain-containing protein [Planctomycetales bacterium]